MKLVTSGLINKIIHIDEQKLMTKKRVYDNLNLALETKHNPFKKPISLKQKHPLNDPELFLVSFQRLCKKNALSR